VASVRQGLTQQQRIRERMAQSPRKDLRIDHRRRVT